MKIIIAGYGFVGQAIEKRLQTRYRVVVVDPKYSNNTISDHEDALGVIISVPTPSDSIGSCDASEVFNVLDTVPIQIPVLIKSTIDPNIIRNIEKQYPSHSICYSPEFLTARNAEKDFATQKFMIIGGEDPEHFWQSLFQSVLTECKLYFNCTMEEASMSKYAINTFLATKVSFFNQIYDMCRVNRVDFERVRHMISHDTRVGASHTLVPGPDGSRGFGGGCFPKDSKAFINYADGLNTPITILKESVEYNQTIRKKP